MQNLIDFENYLKLRVSKLTVQSYLDRLNTFFIVYPEFNQENINKYLQCLLDKERTSSTFNQSLVAIRKYSEFLKLEIDLPKSKKSYKVKRTSLKRDEIENEILPYFDMMFQEPKKPKFIIRFMMLTCMRISEIADLKKSNINFKDRTILVKGKGNKKRTLFIHRSIEEDIKYYFEKSETDSALGVTKNSIRYIFKQINQMLNYKKHVTPHTLRHAGALYIYKETGNDIKFVKNFLGHESIETTDQYLEYDEDDMKEIWKKVKYKKRKNNE